MSPLVRRVRLWWADQHARFRLPWCWQCKLGRHADGGFYEHDEPLWLVRELLTRNAFDEVTVAPGHTYFWSSDGKLRRMR